MKRSTAPPLPHRTKFVLGLVAGAFSAGVASIAFVGKGRIPWVSLLFVEALGLGSLWLGVVIMKMIERRGGFVYSSVLFEMTKSDRKQVAKAVQKGRVVDDPRLVGAAVAYARETISRFRWVAGTFSLMAIFQIISAITGNHRLWHVGGVIVYVACTAVWLHLRRMAHRSLSANSRLSAP